MAGPTTSTRMRIGLSNVVYSIMDDTTDVSAGTISYGTVYPLLGAVALSFDRAGNITSVFGDDGEFASGETVGDMKVSLEVNDILPADYARILGYTYANGIVSEGITDVSPYVAIGFKTLRMGMATTNKVYEYFWLPKCMFAKPKSDEKTKDKSLAPRTVALNGDVLRTASNGKYMVRARDDDGNVAAATITGWFTQPIYNPAVDLGAFTLTSATGVSGTKAFVLTFAKAGGGTTVVGNGSLNNVFITLVSGGALVPLAGATFTPGAANVAPTLTIVATGTITAGATIVSVTPGITDANGVACVAKSLNITVS